MKTMVKLAVLMATLLLLTGVAFANGDCHNYEFTYYNLDNPEQSGTWCVELCFNSGTYLGFCGTGNGNFVSFFDSMNKQALWYSTSTIGWPQLGYLKFHGDWLYIFNGIMYCNSDRFNGRYAIRGHKVDSCERGM